LIVLTSLFLAGPEGAIRRRDAFIGGGGSGGGGCCCLVGIRGGDDSCGGGSGGCVAASFVVNALDIKVRPPNKLIFAHSWRVREQGEGKRRKGRRGRRKESGEYLLEEKRG